jgi:hypothetical protein
MSFYLIDFDSCREQGKIIAALREDCAQLSALLRADGREELAGEADALGLEMGALSEAVFAAVQKKETADMQVLHELGQRDWKEGN